MLEAVEYEWRHFREDTPNIYYEKPTAEVEKAWGKLWECMLIELCSDFADCNVIQMVRQECQTLNSIS
jgi:hypothetical protein